MFASAVGGVPGHGAMPPPNAEPPPMNEVAKLLEMSGSEVNSQLRAGKTLGTLASEHGVPSTELLKTIETELAAKRPEGAPELSASELTELAEGIASGKPPAPPGAQQAGLGGHSGGETFAQMLGIQPSVLLEQLERGTSIESLLPQLGYTRDGSSSQAADVAGVAFSEYA